MYETYERLSRPRSPRLTAPSMEVVIETEDELIMYHVDGIEQGVASKRISKRNLTLIPKLERVIGKRMFARPVSVMTEIMTSPDHSPFTLSPRRSERRHFQNPAPEQIPLNKTSRNPVTGLNVISTDMFLRSSRRPRSSTNRHHTISIDKVQSPPIPFGWTLPV